MIVNMWALIWGALATYNMNSNKWSNTEEYEIIINEKKEAPILTLIDSWFRWTSVEEYTQNKRNFRFQKWDEIKFVNFSEADGMLWVENNLDSWYTHKTHITNDTYQLFLWIKKYLI